MIGCLQVKVCRGDFTAPASFYVVRKGTPILGRDIMKALCICIEGDAVLPPVSANSSSTPSAVSCATVLPAPVLSTTSAPASCIPAPPDIGCAQYFVHKVKIDLTVKPVLQKLRHLPFAVRASVTAELDRLLKAGVIERIDASPWVSPIVVTRRRTGGIQMCPDLREPNKAVVTDCYPLPHAYYQLPLHEDSRDLTAFITHDGRFRFTVLHLPPQPSRK